MRCEHIAAVTNVKPLQQAVVLHATVEGASYPHTVFHPQAALFGLIPAREFP
jgi:hypothetical protein